MKQSARLLLVTLSVLFFSVEAGHHGSSSDKQVSNQQLAGAISYLFRRFMRYAAPDQIKLQDALDIKWRRGMMSSPKMESSMKTSFNGTKRRVFNSIYTVVNPEQKGLTGDGSWSSNNISDLLMNHHWGAPLLIHMINETGGHHEAVLGNPLFTRRAQFSVLIPHGTLATLESMSRKQFTLLSIASMPEWSMKGHERVSWDQMASRFPQFSTMIHNIADPSKTPTMHNEGDEHHEDDEDHHHHHEHHHMEHDDDEHHMMEHGHHHEDNHHGHHESGDENTVHHH